MQPANRARIFSCASAGAIQLLFGPASSLLRVHTKVRCSTRATSEGLERARWQPGNSFSLSFNSSPLAFSCSRQPRDFALGTFAPVDRSWLGQVTDRFHPFGDLRGKFRQREDGVRGSGHAFQSL